MSHPLTPNQGDDFDWDSLLNMDAVEQDFPNETWQTARGPATDSVPLGGLPTASTPLAEEQSSHWQSSVLPVLQQQQQHQDADPGGTYWAQAAAVGVRGNAMYIPRMSPSRQMQTIDSVVAMPNDDPGSQFDSEAVGFPDHSMVGYPDPSSMPNADMSWLGSGSEALLGSFAPDPASMSPLRPPLHMSAPEFALPEPAMIQQDVRKEDRHEWSYHTDQPAFMEPDQDSHLRDALLQFTTRNDRSRSSPPRHNHPDNKTSPFPPFSSPASLLSDSPFSPPLFSPPNHQSPAAKRAKPRSRARSQSFIPLPETQGPCLTCGKNYRTSTSPGRCGRCGLKWERHTAVPPTYMLDPAVPDIGAAMEMLYPVSRGRLRMIDDDVHYTMSEPGVEDEWVRKWLDALNTPVPAAETEESGVKASWAANQQTTFNQKAKMDREGEFSAAFVTARLRALWWEVVVFHGGYEGVRSFYPVGGDSAGYGEDAELKFGERLEAIGEVLKLDKRTVMDVVEGRGVGAFVANPWGFHKRKDSNNGCNAKKKHVLKRNRGVAVTPERRKGGSRVSRASSVGTEGHDDDRGSRWSEDEGDFDAD